MCKWNTGKTSSPFLLCSVICQGAVEEMPLEWALWLPAPCCGGTAMSKPGGRSLGCWTLEQGRVRAAAGLQFGWLHANTKVCIHVWLPWLFENLNQVFSKEKVPTAAAGSQNGDNSFPKPQIKIFFLIFFFLLLFFPGIPQNDFSLWENQIYSFFFFFFSQLEHCC